MVESTNQSPTEEIHQPIHGSHDQSPSPEPLEEGPTCPDLTEIARDGSNEQISSGTIMDGIEEMSKGGQREADGGSLAGQALPPPSWALCEAGSDDGTEDPMEGTEDDGDLESEDEDGILRELDRTSSMDESDGEEEDSRSDGEPDPDEMIQDGAAASDDELSERACFAGNMDCDEDMDDRSPTPDLPDPADSNMSNAVDAVAKPIFGRQASGDGGFSCTMPTQNYVFGSNTIAPFQFLQPVATNGPTSYPANGLCGGSTAWEPQLPMIFHGGSQGSGGGGQLDASEVKTLGKRAISAEIVEPHTVEVPQHAQESREVGAKRQRALPDKAPTSKPLATQARFALDEECPTHTYRPLDGLSPGRAYGIIFKWLNRNKGIFDVLMKEKVRLSLTQFQALCSSEQVKPELYHCAHRWHRICEYGTQWHAHAVVLGPTEDLNDFGK